MRSRKDFLIVILCALASCLFANEVQGQEITRQQRNALKSITSAIDRAGRQYKSKKLESSAEFFGRANELLEQLAADASPEVMELIKPEHARLSKAAELLKAEGLEIAEVKALPEPMDADGDQVSFQNMVAPLIVAKCGRCHVRGTRGQFSAATYMSLMASGHVDPGMPNVSRLIEVIEDGDMPPGGSLLDEELNTLKLWIKQGAKVDVAEDENLVTLGPAGEEPPAMEQLQVTMANGTETVSFARDVAPVFVENCTGCHVDPGNNARANFNMTNINQLLRGGDSGAVLVPGSGDESLLVKKLRGTGGGMQMPQGRPELDDKIIKMISKWIDEGATFDGGDPTTSIRTVAAVARAGAMSHEELAAERRTIAANKWQTAMSSGGATTANSKDLLIVSSYDQEKVDAVAEIAQSLAPKIKELFKATRKEPLIKGKTTLYLFERRYDFNEFGGHERRQCDSQANQIAMGATTLSMPTL